MKRTTRARLFEVISRSRQNTIIADQETLRSIVSEVDMFKDFLDEYNAIKPIELARAKNNTPSFARIPSRVPKRHVCRADLALKEGAGVKWSVRAGCVAGNVTHT